MNLGGLVQKIWEDLKQVSVKNVKIERKIDYVFLNLLVWIKSIKIHCPLGKLLSKAAKFDDIHVFLQ